MEENLSEREKKVSEAEGIQKTEEELDIEIQNTLRLFTDTLASRFAGVQRCVNR